MRNVGSRLTKGMLVALLFAGTAVAGKEPMMEEKTDVIVPGEKKAFVFRRGDMTFKLGGKSTTEHRFSKNAVMLNSKLPDQLSHFRQTLDTNVHFGYGEKKYGHNAIELGSTVRFKTVWGQFGKFPGTEKNEKFKVLGTSLGEHTHSSKRSLMWVKNAWLQASWNAIFNVESNLLHTFKIGMFPFYLGRGISLGPIYGATRSFLALYNKDADFSPPGILLSGELLKDKLWYDLYYAKLEDKSASFGDVFNSNKEKILGRRTTPWSGPSKDSDLFAARLKIKPLNKAGNKGELELEPYIFYNEASDQKVELTADSKSMLGAVGLAAEYSFKNFEIGGEVAFNFGSEKLRAIDRNQVVLRSDVYTDNGDFESIHEVYSKVLYDDETNTNVHGKPVVVNPQTESAITKYARSYEGPRANDATWAPDPADDNGVPMYKNASDRYRCAYTNKYRGYMAVLDASYLIDRFDLKVAAAVGIASGDGDPHAVEKNKNYDGFVGLHEAYPGKRVPSLLILDARKVKRPLTLVEGDGEADSDASFTDLRFFGFGATWAPKSMKSRKFSINPNILFFWKDYKSKKYDRTYNDCEGRVDPCCDADRFLGTEINVLAKMELLKDLTLIGNFGYFTPGSYYKDIKGTPMKGDLFNKLEEQDRQDLPSERYRIGTSDAIYTQVALEYKF